MAYSDYGGYAYRNGKRVEERSDCRICHDPTAGDGPTCGAEMCEVAWDLIEWAADKNRLIYYDGYWCSICEADEPGIHTDDCLHKRAAALLASRGTEDS